MSIRKEYWSWPVNIVRLTLVLHPRPNSTIHYGRQIKNVGHNSKRSTTGRVEVHYGVRVNAPSFIDRHWPSSGYTSGPRFELLGQVTWRQGVWSRRLLGWESMLGDEISPSRSRTHARNPLTPRPTSLLSLPKYFARSKLKGSWVVWGGTLLSRPSLVICCTVYLHYESSRNIYSPLNWNLSYL